MSNLKNTLPGSQQIGTASWWLDPHVRSGPEYPAVPAGGRVIRLSLGRKSVNLSPVAQWANPFIYGVVGGTLRTWKFSNYKPDEQSYDEGLGKKRMTGV